jgi:hypothetical protein
MRRLVLPDRGHAGSTRLRVGECGPRQGTEGLGSTRRTVENHRVDPPARGGRSVPGDPRHVRELARKSPAFRRGKVMALSLHSASLLPEPPVRNAANPRRSATYFVISSVRNHDSKTGVSFGRPPTSPQPPRGGRSKPWPVCRGFFRRHRGKNFRPVRKSPA